MTDVEGVPLNPYTNDRRRPNNNEQQQYLSAHHPTVVLKRITYSGISLYGLHLFKAYELILHSPRIRHEWFKIGLATSIGTCVSFRQKKKKGNAWDHANIFLSTT